MYNLIHLLKGLLQLITNIAFTIKFW